MAAKPYKWTGPKRAKFCEDIELYVDQNPHVIHPYRVAESQGMTMQHLYELGKDYPQDVGKSLSVIKEKLECRLVEGAYHEGKNPKFVAFLLERRYSYLEKLEMQSSITLQEATPVFGDE